MDTFLKYFNAAMGFVGAVAAAIAAYIGWIALNPPKATAPGGSLVNTGLPAWAVALFVLGIVMLVTSWTGILHARRRGKPANPGNDAWVDGVTLEKIFNRKFVNETVALDGRHFVNPVFDNVTFFYQGTGPVFMENPTYILHNGKMGSRLASRNKIITMAMKIHDNLLKACGVPVYTLDLGPEATLDAPKLGHEGLARPPASRSVAEQQFEIELRKCVLSRLERVVFGFLNVFHELMNRCEGTPPDKIMPLRQWQALARTMTIGAEVGIRRPLAELTAAVSAQPMNLMQIQVLIAQFLAEYGRSKFIARWLSDATGLAPNQENLTGWRAAEFSCVESLKDLRSSPMAAILQNIPDHPLTDPAFS